MVFHRMWSKGSMPKPNLITIIIYLFTALVVKQNSHGEKFIKWSLMCYQMNTHETTISFQEIEHPFPITASPWQRKPDPSFCNHFLACLFSFTPKCLYANTAVSLSAVVHTYLCFASFTFTCFWDSLHLQPSLQWRQLLLF